jgi:hypothetical protein
MKTIKVKVKTTSINEVAVQLPYYSVSESHFFKVYGVELWDAICVSYPAETACKIQQTLAEHALNYGAKECTEKEFDIAYKKALDYLTFKVCC